MSRLWNAHIYFCFKHSFFFVQKPRGKKSNFISFLKKDPLWCGWATTTRRFFKLLPGGTAHTTPTNKRDECRDAIVHRLHFFFPIATPLPPLADILLCSISVLFFLSFFSSLIFVFWLEATVVVGEGCRRRTSAGVAVPATTSIKISRPDVNYRLESFAERNEREKQKRVKDYTHRKWKDRLRDGYTYGRRKQQQQQKVAV